MTARGEGTDRQQEPRLLRDLPDRYGSWQTVMLGGAGVANRDVWGMTVKSAIRLIRDQLLRSRGG